MRRPLLARNAKAIATLCVSLGAGIVGCAAIAGINDGADPTKASGDASSGGDGTMSPAEGGTSAEGAGPCVANVTQQPTGTVHAQRAMAEPVIDGKLDEWACIDRVDIGMGVVNKDMPALVAGSQHVEFALLWTPADLFFYAHAITKAPGFDNTGSQVFANDSVHLIIGRSPPPTTSGTFRTGDHQLTFDYKGRFGDYVNGNFVGTPVAAVASSPAGQDPIDFQIEARIPAASLGLTNFTAGQTLVFNIMLVDATAMNAIGFRLWRLPDKATCPCDAPGSSTACCARIGTQDSPTCDIRCTQSLQLD